jgi:hypothetical protein
MKDDILIAQPPQPTEGGIITWLDTGDGTYKDFSGFVGDVVFDTAVQIRILAGAQGVPDSQLRVMNGEGFGDEVTPGVPTPIRVGFLGARTVIQLLVDGDAIPEVWHANGRLTKGDLGGPATGTISWGLLPSSPGPTGLTGARGPTGPTGPTGPAGPAGAGGYQFFFADGTVDLAKTHTDVEIAGGTVTLTLPNGTADHQPHTFRTMAPHATNQLVINATIIDGLSGGTSSGNVGAHVIVRDTNGVASVQMRWNVGVAGHGNGWVVELLNGDGSSVYPGDAPE